MSGDFIRALAVTGFIALFASTILITSYVTESPEYPRCAVCTGQASAGACTCPSYEDFVLWGMIQKIRWESLLGFLLLLGLSAYSIAAAVDRAMVFRAAGRESREFESSISTLIFERRFEDAISLSACYEASPVAVVVHASLQGNPRGNQITTGPIKVSMEARQRAITLKTEELKRGLWALAATDRSVVLVGLLLFLATLINALHSMRAAEGRGIAPIAGSLIDALWGPVFSIVFAVPAIWWHKYLTSTASSFVLEMDRMSLALIGGIVGHEMCAADSVNRSVESALATSELTVLPTRELTRESPAAGD